MQKAIIIQILTACSYLKDMASIYIISNKKSNQIPYKCKTTQDKRQDQMTNNMSDQEFVTCQFIMSNT
jgi:hypothetical protein